MCRFVDKFPPTLLKVVNYSFFPLQIVELSKSNCILLTYFVDVDFWHNIDVECRPEAEKIVDLHFPEKKRKDFMKVFMFN